MKTIIAIMIVTAGFAMTAPAASACDVFEDPTGVTQTCVDEYENGSGDQTCEEPGYHFEATRATTGVPGVFSLTATAWSYCSSSGFGSSSGDGRSVSGDVANTVRVNADQGASEGDSGSMSGARASVHMSGVGGARITHTESDDPSGSTNSTSGSANIYNVGTVDVARSETEHTYGGYSRTAANAKLNGVGSVGVGHTEYEHDIFGSGCVIYVAVNGENVQELDC